MIKINAQIIKIERFLRIIEGITIICKFWAHIFVLDLATDRKRKEPVIHESDEICEKSVQFSQRGQCSLIVACGQCSLIVATRPMFFDC